MGSSKLNGQPSFDEIEKFTFHEEQKILNKIGFSHSEFHKIEHHHCHAASAYYTSGYDDALIITMDGAGDGLCATANIIENGKIKRISEASSDISPGTFYAEITRYLGYKRNRHEGKITGLAAYGNPNKYYSSLKEYLHFNIEDERFSAVLNQQPAILRKLNTVRRILRKENTGNVYIDLFFEYLKKNYNKQNDAKDLAATAQQLLEDIVVEYVNHFRKENPRKNIALAGGVFANVKVNQKISEIEGVKSIYIHPNMGDGGCATGAAFSYLHEIKGIKYSYYKPSDVYYGEEFSDQEIEKVLRQHNVNYQKIENIEIKIAELLHEGKVVGRFNGRMEYGPRALGNRSILVRPTDRSVNDWLNKKLCRTEFMPFAPAVLAEEASSLFVNYENQISDHTARFMTITYDVQQGWHDKLQAAIHIDNTARPQIVYENQNPSLYRVIKEYFNLSRIPAVINTSFNMHEEPIVRTPDDAVRAFKQGCLNYLAIGNYLCQYQ
ncbi:MAG: carbamoyltransferase [Bacteroidia bacterium]|nr:carbamoyltransferase [Bacteroidia bacterium]